MSGALSIDVVRPSVCRMCLSHANLVRIILCASLNSVVTLVEVKFR